MQEYERMSVKDAAKLTGLKMPVIINLIKTLQVFGMCIETPDGYRWFISPEALPQLQSFAASRALRIQAERKRGQGGKVGSL